MKKICISIFIYVFVLSSGLYGQSLNCPVDSLFGGRYNVTALGEYSSRSEENMSFISFKGLLQLEIGIFRWISLYGSGGIARLDIDYPEMENITDFKGGRGMALGGGIRLNTPIPEVLPVGLYCYGGVLRFKSEGRVRDKIEDTFLRFKFDRREFCGGIGTILRLKKLDFYTGYEGKSMQRIDKMSETEYVTGLYHIMFAGVNLKLPDRSFFSIQARFFGEYSVSASLCQLSK